jgi:hypothetical protein
MLGEFYFMAIAGLGISFAGFAGVIAALDRRPSSPVSLWRISYIVRGGFILLFAGFGTVAVYTATGQDLNATIRLSSLFLAISNAATAVVAQRPGPAWPDERGRRFAQVASWTVIALLLLNVALARLGFLQFLFLAQVADPASIFLNAVRDVARGDPADETS